MEHKEDVSAALSRAQPLAGLIDYQPGAIVSRVVLRGKGGNVTLFAFDADQSLSEHSAPHDALIVVLEGRTEVTIAGEPRPLDAGDAILIRGGLAHAVVALERFKMLLTMLREA